MSSISISELSKLQYNTTNIRNITMLAHVDHGKTTLSDHLISSNGIISQKLAGKVRFLDNRADEQEREITMKSSSISLLHEYNNTKYLINLIDSPGHIDFSNEVSSAVRVSDGGLVLVDAVEGVQVQTHTVLKQAWDEKVQCILVINKIDKLFTELKLTPIEAYVSMCRIIEQVNAITSSFLVSDAMERAAVNEAIKPVEVAGGDYDESINLANYEVEIDDSKGMEFSPDRGNVVFASSLDSWAFTLYEFANFYSKRLGFSQQVLLRCLWGDHFFQSKSKQVLKRIKDKGNALPMFVQFILEPISTIYRELLDNKNGLFLPKITEKLDLKIPQRDMLAKDFRTKLQTLFYYWIPIQKTILNAVVRQLPSPIEAQPRRMVKFDLIEENEEKIEKKELSDEKDDDSVPGAGHSCTIANNGYCKSLLTAVEKCDNSSTAPVMVYIAKLFGVKRQATLPKSQTLLVRKTYIRGLYKAAADDFAAIPGSPLINSSSPSFDSEFDNVESSNSANKVISLDNPVEIDHDVAGSPQRSKDIKEVSKDIEELDPNEEIFIGFGRIFSGIVSATSTLYVFGPSYNPNLHILSSELTDEILPPHCVKLTPGTFQLYLLMGPDIMPVDSVPAGNVFGISGLGNRFGSTATISTLPKVVPMKPTSMQSAPIVRVAIEPRNISQIKDLTQGLALLSQSDGNIQITEEGGEFILVVTGELHLEKCIRDLQDRYAPGLSIKVSPPIVPFRETILPVGQIKSTTFSTANKLVTFTIKAHPLPENVLAYLTKFIEGKFKKKKQTEVAEDINNELQKAGGRWKNGQILWNFGSKLGANLLLMSNNSPYFNSLERILGHENLELTDSKENLDFFQSIEKSIVGGVQLALSSGPLMDEPMMGIVIEVEDILVISSDDAENKEEISLTQDSHASLSGQIISSVKEGCRKAVQASSLRIMEPVYKVELQATAEVLGRLYGVLNKRRGVILDEKLKEGTNYFAVFAYLPVSESFGFADEIRIKTSGVAFPQLVLDHWSLITMDPLYIPQDDEEATSNLNIAKKLVEQTRRRKGLFVEEKFVQFGSKQRTLSKKA